MCGSGGRFSVVESRMGTRLVSLASGSSGNALLVQHDTVTGLIDCGIGANRLRSELLAFGLRLSELSFVYVTHEHIDHIRAAPALMRAGVPIVTGPGTARAMGVDPGSWIGVRHGTRFECGGIEVRAVRTSHDAAEPLGAVVSFGGITAAVFTDLGEWDEITVDAMRDADVIVVEANHNLEMLKRGPYPAHLKRRVLSSVGHLSNEDCGRLTEVVRQRASRLPVIYLAHLSETNNTPGQAVLDVATSGSWLAEGLCPLPRATVMNLLTNQPAVPKPPAEIQSPLFSMEPTSEPGS